MSKHTQVLFYGILSFKSVRGIDKIIFPDGQSVSSSMRVDLLLPVVGSWHCTRAYVYVLQKPAGRPDIPKPWYWHGTEHCTAGVS